jgi:hypothetical protein
MRKIRETRHRLVEGGRLLGFGTYRLPFRETGLKELNVFPRLEGWLPRRLLVGLSRLRLKQWQHFAVINPSHYLGMVVFDAGFLGFSFIYHLDRERGVVVEHHRTGPPGSAEVAESAWRGECQFVASGYSMRFTNRMEEGRHRLAFYASSPGKPTFSGEVFMLEDPERYQPLVAVSPFSPQRPLYTHKNLAPAEGRVNLGRALLELRPERDVCLIDEHKAFYPYRSFWRWATFGGYTEDGRLVGVNLCQNNIAEDWEYNENCLWVDGKIRLLGPARFGFSEARPLEPWFVKTLDGQVDLEFLPSGERAQRMGLGPVYSDFHQPFGIFRGSLGSGNDFLRVEGMFGLCENHVSRY